MNFSLTSNQQEPGTSRGQQNGNDATVSRDRRPYDKTCCHCIQLKKLCIGYGYVVMAIHSCELAKFLYEHNQGYSHVDERLLLSLRLPLKILNLGFIIVLLAGLHEAKPQYARVYLVFCMIYLIFIISVTVCTLVADHGNVFEVCFLFVIFILTILMVVALIMYFLFVLRNYYDQIYEETKELPVNTMLASTRHKISSTFLGVTPPERKLNLRD